MVQAVRFEERAEEVGARSRRFLHLWRGPVFRPVRAERGSHAGTGAAWRGVYPEKVENVTKRYGKVVALGDVATGAGRGVRMYPWSEQVAARPPPCFGSSPGSRSRTAQKEAQTLEEENYVNTNRAQDLLQRAVQAINGDKRYKLIINASA